MNKIYTDWWDELQVGFESNSPIVGIKRFACALIVRAILDSRHKTIPRHNTSNVTRDDKRTAIEWLMHSTSDDPASFAWCCSILNLEPNEVRFKLKHLPQELLDKIIHY